VKGPRVLALTAEENGCTLWRVWQPYSELQRRGYGAWFRDKDDPEMDAPEWPYLAATRLDAVILPRLSWQDQIPARRWIASLHNAGLAVIYDLDDDVLSPQIGARQRATTEPNKSLVDLERDRRDRIAAIRLCDGVTTSCAQLATVIRQYVDTPVHIVPNGIDVSWFRRAVHGVRRTVAPVSIGWAGGARYLEDLEPIAEAWHNLAKRFSHVRFVVQGFMADVLVTAVPPEQLVQLPWMSVAEYPRGMRNIDIGCASVADKPFNHCKTPIKAWEFTLAGACVVASPTLYGPVVTDEQDGLIAETAAEWERQLTRLIESPELGRRLWRAQRRRLAMQHSLDRTVLEWPKAWSAIIETFRNQRRLALAG
jgi:glycosyltransferase involved in cell wall biosynthesis